MKYYAQYNENSKLIAIGTGYCNGIEITESEYNALLSEIRTKADLVDKLYNAEIAISAIQKEWQKEIQRRVDERIANEHEQEEEATAEDYRNALRDMGVEV